MNGNKNSMVVQSKIKVLHIIWSANIGGIEKVVFDLIRTQHKNPMLESELLVCRDTGVYLERFKAAGINCTVLSMKNAFDISFAKAKLLKNLFALFDILHFHSFNPFVASKASTSGKKIIYTEHGNFAFGRKASMMERLNTNFLKSFLNKHVHFISFNSQFSKRTAEERYLLSRVDRKVIYNGIEFSSEKNNELATLPHEVRNKIENKFVVGTASRFAAVKKIERLVRAFAIFSKEKSNVCLLLCGDGPSRKEYESLVAQLSLNEKVLFTGFTDHISSYQSAMHVAVYSSQGEAFGLVAVESLALGVPVIVFKDGGGLVEIAEKISSDDIVNSEDELSGRLEFYFQNKDALHLLNEKRKQVAKEFDIKLMELKFFQEYQSLTATS